MHDKVKTAATRRGTRRSLHFGFAFVVTLVLSMLTVTATFADAGRKVRIRDKCDPVTFNAALGEGACVGNGNVTFDELLATLNPQDGGHRAWRFSPDEAKIKAGEVLHVVNNGGEVHSFTEVSQFGTVDIPPLDAALPPGTPPAQPIEDLDPTFLVPGGTRVLSGLSPGTHMFQCFIHPWMRSVIEVRGH